MAKSKSDTLRFGQYSVDLSNPDKVLFQQAGLTKRDLVEYYRKMTPVLLPHLRDRPLILHRYPDGAGTDGFIQQRANEQFPEWMATATVDQVTGGDITHPMASRAADLAYLANLATLSLHAWLSRSSAPRKPDQLLFDLDPPEKRSPGEGIRLVVRAAHELRELLERQGLITYAKSTGSRGLHVVAPIRPDMDVDTVRDFARIVADRIVEIDPEAFTTEARKEDRGDRLYVDISRMAYGQSAVTPYSPRALPDAPVAVPLVWEEVTEEFDPRAVTIADLDDRLDRMGGDPWSGISRKARSLSAAWAKLGER